MKKLFTLMLTLLLAVLLGFTIAGCDEDVPPGEDVYDDASPGEDVYDGVSPGEDVYEEDM